MPKLPFHVKRDHLGEIRGGDRLVEGRSSFSFIECLPDRFARKLDAERFVEREETIEPMQAVTIESAAHVEKNCANHEEGRSIRCRPEICGPPATAKARVRLMPGSLATR